MLVMQKFSRTSLTEELEKEDKIEELGNVLEAQKRRVKNRIKEQYNWRVIIIPRKYM